MKKLVFLIFLICGGVTVYAADFPTGSFKCTTSYDRSYLAVFSISKISLGAEELPFIHFTESDRRKSVAKKGLGIVSAERNVVSIYLPDDPFKSAIYFHRNGSITGFNSQYSCSKQ
jgi:hypothetical protein